MPTFAARRANHARTRVLGDLASTLRARWVGARRTAAGRNPARTTGDPGATPRAGQAKARGAGDLVLALRAEWAKARSVGDLALAMALTVAATIGVAGLVAAMSDGTGQSRSGLIGLQLGQAIVAVAGVQILAGEYSTGLIQPTLLAFPTRWPVLLAKALLLTAATATAAVAATAAAAATAGAQPVIHLILIALLGLGTAALLRSAVASAGTVLALLFVLPAMVRWMPDPDWARLLYRLSPSTALTDTAHPWPQLAVTAAWTTTALVLGTIALITRRVS